MNELALAIFGVLVGLVIFQALPALGFVSLFRSPTEATMQSDSLPKAAVVLCLRGADPFLTDCVHALLNQNYPQYHVQIVVDSQEDPAWKIVNDVIARSQATHVQVCPLRVRHETCSLKGSALVQAISELDDCYEVVALLDADVITHPDWLRELVAPLADEGVGATTGNRWYAPQTDRWGSLVRYIWNAAAVVTMYIYNYAWGGSMAMKLSVLRRSRLLEKWKQAVSVDTLILTVLQEIGLKVKFVPTVMMSNREDCDLTRCFRFIKRQFLVTWLYNPKRTLVAVRVFTTTLALVLAILVLLIALVSGNFGAAALVGGGFIGYILAMGLILAFLEQGVRRVGGARGEPTTRFSTLVIAKMLVAIPLTQLVCAVAMISAILARSVEWRGITYQIKGAWNVQLIDYRPFSSPAGDTNISV
jgi:cellulose synthase/poly-beta-1,6-N-acetylglucosamine synthase-like glycosyltransferase